MGPLYFSRLPLSSLYNQTTKWYIIKLVSILPPGLIYFNLLNIMISRKGQDSV